MGWWGFLILHCTLQSKSLPLGRQIFDRYGASSIFSFHTLCTCKNLRWLRQLEKSNTIGLQWLEKTNMAVVAQKYKDRFLDLFCGGDSIV